MENNALTNEAARVCLDCGGPIGPGRADKKFCSPACKTNYNNVLKAQEKPVKATVTEDVPPYVLEVEKILRKNRLILANIVQYLAKDRLAWKNWKDADLTWISLRAKRSQLIMEISIAFVLNLAIRSPRIKKTAVVVARKAVIEELN